MRPPSIRACALILGGLLALAPSVRPAQAAFVATETSQVTQLANQQFLYSYTINVAASSTVFASEFDLAFSGTVIESSIVSPNNFTYVYGPNDPSLGTTLSFFATDDGSGTSDIGISPGSSGTFSFRSTFGPAAGMYQASGYSTTTGDSGSLQGINLTPSVVPEPSSLALAGLGLAGALGFSARSRRQARA